MVLGTIKIGLLNFSPLGRVKDHLNSIQELIEFAQFADQLHFSRFWLAEHYLYKQLQSWTIPDMLIPIIAASTENIKVGLAGSLINVHQPLDIATNFKLLANLFPDRIDLGFAKGGDELLSLVPPAEASLTTQVLFQKKAKMIIDYLYREKEYFDNGLVIPPLLGCQPDIWLLGASYRSLLHALELGANFSRSLFHLNHDPKPQTSLLNSHINSFQERHKKIPEVNIAIAACCSTSSNKISKQIRNAMDTGLLKIDLNNIISGSPVDFKDKIYDLHRKYKVDEFILLPLYENHKERLIGIELMAKSFGFL